MNNEIKIRNATVNDAQTLLEIYAPYVKSTAITFEWTVPTLIEFENRIKTISSNYPYIVAELNGVVRGYAYANTFRSRKAYSWTAESSIYVQQEFVGKGIGKILLQELEKRLTEQNVLNLYAVIASTECEDEFLTNASVKFHEKMGYKNPCIFYKCGFKFNRWYNTTTMEKFLGEHKKKSLPAILEKTKIPSIDLIHQKYRQLTNFLIKNNLSITTMESCTSGFIASLITDTEGSSAIFKGAYVTYCNEAKILNGVPEEVIKNYGVYSTQTASAMAEACVKKYSADIGIGITGTFGNVDFSNADSVPGKVFIAIKIKNKMQAFEFSLMENISRFESKLAVAEKVVNSIFVELGI